MEDIPFLAGAEAKLVFFSMCGGLSAAQRR